MLAQACTVRLARLGASLASRLGQPAPCISSVRHMGLYDEKERGDEVRLPQHYLSSHGLGLCTSAALTFVLGAAAHTLCKGG